MTLYANVKTSSKYSNQATPEPFKVYFLYDSAGYHIKGNANQYRITDIDFYLKNEKGSYRNISPQLAKNFGLAIQNLLEQLDNVCAILDDDERFINLTPEEKEAEQWDSQVINFNDWHYVWELNRATQLKEKLNRLAKVLPTKEPDPERY